MKIHTKRIGRPDSVAETQGVKSLGKSITDDSITDDNINVDHNI